MPDRLRLPPEENEASTYTFNLNFPNIEVEFGEKDVILSPLVPLMYLQR